MLRGQAMPFIRTVLQTLPYGEPPRFRTLPGVLGNRGDRLVRGKVGKPRRPRFRRGCRQFSRAQRLNCATNIPGARSPTLLPYGFCQALNAVFSSLIVVPTAPMSGASLPWRLLRWAASLRSALACRLLVAWYRLLSRQSRRVLPCLLTRPFSS